jgi:hypothetical protein
MHRSPSPSSLLVLVLLAAHAVYAASPAAATAPARFEDLQVEGTTLDAKASGFRDCTSSYDGFACRRNGPTELLGVAASSATVYLEPPGPKYERKQANVPLQALVYTHVDVAFDKTQYNGKCAEKMHAQGWNAPFECRVNDQGMDFFVHQLRLAGWIGQVIRRTEVFVHPSSLVQIEVVNLDREHTAKLSRVAIAERDALIASERAKHAADNATRSRDDQMKALMK